MTMIGVAGRPSDSADPHKTQRRVAVSGSGEQVWVDITGNDRLAYINKLPGRWPEVVKARESGKTLEEIHRWAKVPLCQPHCRAYTQATTEDGVVRMEGHEGPACLRFYLAGIYADLETYLHELAARRGRLLP